ncbi:hypothetical protein DP825_02605 [Salmonella enterica subsp. enterica serovar Saintpaul]|nr:hypothetical protein [Salmonella enterica subsp. enterica serovar Saintpaul]ECJ1508053.1 hypothetical protein [Salmonella enterica subsp. enterica serovar Saintpaul]ECJ1576079.1 hypothetical protein [Salmonella enterica subsp. enterica serovar Saintpaul]
MSHSAYSSVISTRPCSQQHRSNNKPRTRGDFFHMNSLRRVLFYGVNDGSCYRCHLSLSPRGY